MSYFPPNTELEETKKLLEDIKTTNGRRNGVAEFLVSFVKMLIDEKNQHLMEWNTHAGILHVYDPKTLAVEVLPQYFKHSNYSSFQRQLNYFGFRKMSGKGRLAPCRYANEFISSGRPVKDFLWIQRKTGPKKQPPANPKQDRDKALSIPTLQSSTSSSSGNWNDMERPNKGGAPIMLSIPTATLNLCQASSSSSEDVYNTLIARQLNPKLVGFVSSTSSSLENNNNNMNPHNNNSQILNSNTMEELMRTTTTYPQQHESSLLMGLSNFHNQHMMTSYNNQDEEHVSSTSTSRLFRVGGNGNNQALTKFNTEVSMDDDEDDNEYIRAVSSKSNSTKDYSEAGSGYASSKDCSQSSSDYNYSHNDFLADLAVIPGFDTSGESEPFPMPTVRGNNCTDSYL